MRLGKKWAIQSALFAVIATAVLLLVVNLQLRRHGIQAAEQTAKLVLQERKAVIFYVRNKLHPSVYKLTKEKGIPPSYFDPTWMSASYINRMLMKYFTDSEFNQYYFKNATVNARSPENEADEYEKAFLEKITNNTEINSWSEVIDFAGRPFFIYMEANRARFTIGCLRCHSTPENAPADLVSLYGSERSFNKKRGDIASVLSLRIPLAEVYGKINVLTITLSLLIVGILAVIFFVQWFIVKKSLIAPIKKITDKSKAIAHDESLLGEEIIMTGQGELTEMADAFSDMSQKLARSKELLEATVEERTRQSRESREQAQSYLNIAGVMFAVLDRSGEITLLNPKGCEMLGISEQQAVGLNWFDNFLPQQMVKEKKEIFSRLMLGEDDIVEYYENSVLTKSGEIRIVAFHNSLLKSSEGGIVGILWSGEDVTERRLIEKEKRQLEVQLRQSHKMEAIGTLAGGIAHDFNNILSVILGYAELAKDNIPIYNPAQEQIDLVLVAGNRAKELVKHILAFSRKEVRTRVPVGIHQIVTEAVALIRATIPTTIEIQQNIASFCGNILAESTQLHQVLMNLCTNAAQAMEETGGVLQIDLSTIELTVDDFPNELNLKPGSYVHLAVKDNGPGIDEQYLERIFDPYFTTKDFGKGSGMGLAVVIGIVKGHDGMISVESKPGKGAVFNVYFPLIAEEIHEKEIDIDPLPTGSEKILIVDDEEAMADLTAQRLERLGYRVTTIIKSMQALELFRSQPDFFDLVITDQTMPGLTGRLLARELMSIRPDIPIILCSGYSSQMDAEKAHILGINSFMMKPVNYRELAITIRQIFDGIYFDRSDGGA